MILARRLLADESGATAIEYGLIVSMIFLVIVASLHNFASGTGNMYNRIATGLNAQ